MVKEKCTTFKGGEPEGTSSVYTKGTVRSNEDALMDGTIGDSQEILKLSFLRTIRAEAWGTWRDGTPVQFQHSTSMNKGGQNAC